MLAEAGRVAVCCSADGMSLDLRTEIITVLGSDVRSCEFVAEYLRKPSESYKGVAMRPKGTHT